MKLYTKTGDKGTTSLFGGQRVTKHHARLEAYGTIDELNANLGVALSLCSNDTLSEQLIRIQRYLFTLGSHLATPYDPAKSETLPDSLPVFEESEIIWLEALIDEYSATTPELRQFILPGGSLLASQLHVTRTVCRRAERMTTALTDVEPIDDHSLRYLNRLSDYLFALSRFVNHQAGVAEMPWQPNA